MSDEIIVILEDDLNVGFKPVPDIKVDGGVDSALPSHKLSTHSDADFASADNANGLKYNSATDKWEAVEVPAFDIATSQITNWDTAHGWGDHGEAGYAEKAADLFDGRVIFGDENGKATQSDKLNWLNDLKMLSINGSINDSTLVVQSNNVSTPSFSAYNSAGQYVFRVKHDRLIIFPVSNYELYPSVDGTSINLGAPSVVFKSPFVYDDSAYTFTTMFRSASRATISAGKPLFGGFVVHNETTQNQAGDFYQFAFVVKQNITQTGTANQRSGAICAELTYTNAADARAFESNKGKIMLGGNDEHSYMVLHRLTATQRDALTNLVAGAIIYNTTDNKAQCYNGTAWQNMF